MTKFDEWWEDNRDGYTATPLMQKCFDGGYEQGYADAAAAVDITKLVLLAVSAACAVFCVIILF